MANDDSRTQSVAGASSARDPEQFIVEQVDGLSISLAQGVLSVTIDRPATLNSLTPNVLGGIADAMDAAAIDARVKVVRLGGAGRGFSSGAGIAGGAGEGHGPTDTLTQADRAVRAIADLPRPVVAVVQGPAAGVGVSLALACDIVLASEKAFLMLAFTKIGLMPDGGSTASVAAAVGRIRAMRMALLAERIPAAEALQWGLVSAVYPDELFDDEVAGVLSRLATGPSVAYAKTKHAVNAVTLTELDGALKTEFDGQAMLLGSHDFREGVRAFQERRAPQFSDF
jgi:enoyl-CoA hydratase